MPGIVEDSRLIMTMERTRVSAERKQTLRTFLPPLPGFLKRTTAVLAISTRVESAGFVHAEHLPDTFTVDSASMKRLDRSADA